MIRDLLPLEEAILAKLKTLRGSEDYVHIMRDGGLEVQDTHRKMCEWLVELYFEGRI